MHKQSIACDPEDVLSLDFEVVDGLRCVLACCVLACCVLACCVLACCVLACCVLWLLCAVAAVCCGCCVLWLLCAVAGCQAPQWDRQASLNAHRLTTHRPQQNHRDPANQLDAGIKGNAGRSRSGYRLIALLKLKQDRRAVRRLAQGFLAS